MKKKAFQCTLVCLSRAVRVGGRGIDDNSIGDDEDDDGIGAGE